MLTFAEENYLKAIYHLSEAGKKVVSTNEIAYSLDTKASSVTDMLQRLATKGVLDYIKYKGGRISAKGMKAALMVIRKHRMWETFLVEKLKFNWDEVHEVAEQLEHIKSPLLIKRLDEFLGYPKFDPHGDPIPDENGEFSSKPQIKLSELDLGKNAVVVGVLDHSTAFLQHLDRIRLQIGTKIKLIDRIEFDGSLEIELDEAKKMFVSRDVSENVLISEP